MPLHFAGSRRPSRSIGARCLRLPAGLRAANDNGRPLRDDALLRSTLLHFAAHGLGAAAEARDRAEEAWLTGDGEAYHHWLSVCRTLDRRMARGATRG